LKMDVGGGTKTLKYISCMINMKKMEMDLDRTYTEERE
jgi:hypothetical protein